MITRLQAPEYRPDQSAASGVLLTARNVYAAVDGYRPVKALATFTDPLDATFNGGYSAIANDGTAYLLSGTVAGLYQLESDGTWTTLVDSLTITLRWKFAQFGDYVVTVNGSDTREVDLLGGTANAISGAPTGNSIAVVGDHVVIGQADGEILKVRWSAFRDHTGWTNGTNQAGEQPMQTGGAVMGVAGGEYGVILQRERIVRMTRTGDADTPFQFDEISANFGCADGATIAQAGRSVFFYSDRGFMALEDGQALKPIGTEKVDRTFAASISRDDLKNIYTAVDPENKLVLWGVPGTPGTVWIYNFELDRWTTAQLSFSGLFPGFTTSTGIDDLAALYADIDAMTLTFDDPRWNGGNPKLYAVNVDGELGTLTGDNLAARLAWGFSELAPGLRARVRAARPVTDVTSGFTLELDSRLRLGDVESLTTAGTIRASGLVPIRASGRYIAPAMEYAAGAEWTYVQGLEVEFEPGGRR